MPNQNALPNRAMFDSLKDDNPRQTCRGANGRANGTGIDMRRREGIVGDAAPSAECAYDEDDDEDDGEAPSDSPITLQASTVRKMHAPGKTASHGSLVIVVCA